MAIEPAPELDVIEWLNGPDQSLQALHGKVVMIEAFQMLCPGCVSHGIPLAQRVAQTFNRDDVAVLGLHTVFEHHAVMGRDALAVFLSEYKVTFPVGIDRPSVGGNPIPSTMGTYGMQGTPTTLLIDRHGYLRFHRFGRVDELVFGAVLGQLIEDRGEQAGG
ncbi:MAG TPA: TlpA disulfide reductase family protein [Ilumatobacteraceae bacterium]|nr:TlpA disulfide reductase family protein [Ilumatobacteraceae bacterium]